VRNPCCKMIIQSLDSQMSVQLANVQGVPSRETVRGAAATGSVDGRMESNDHHVRRVLLEMPDGNRVMISLIASSLVVSNPSANRRRLGTRISIQWRDRRDSVIIASQRTMRAVVSRVWDSPTMYRRFCGDLYALPEPHVF